MIPKNSLQLHAYNTIKEQILNNTLQPDVMYSETQMARELGISRTPMREALQCLSQDGYITIIPSRGFTLRRLDQETMRESIQIRCAIEGFCVHLITSEGNTPAYKALMKELKKSLRRQEKALTAPDFPASFMEEDHHFHLLLVHYADNQEFNHLFQRLMYTIHLTTANALVVDGRASSTYEEHKLLYKSLEEEQGPFAYHVLISHLMMPLTIAMMKEKNQS